MFSFSVKFMLLHCICDGLFIGILLLVKGMVAFCHHYYVLEFFFLVLTILQVI